MCGNTVKRTGWLLFNPQPGVPSKKWTEKCFDSHTFAQRFLILSSSASVLGDLLGLPPSTRYSMLNVREISFFSKMLKKSFRNQMCNGEWASRATTEGEALTLPEVGGFQQGQGLSWVLAVTAHHIYMLQGSWKYEGNVLVLLTDQCY